MRNIAFIIQARTGSTRLPNKVIKPFFEDLSILEIIIIRILENFDYPLWVATSNSKRDDAIESILKNYSINIYRGSEYNVLSRYCSIIKENNYDYIVRICADNPFINNVFIKEQILQIENNEFDYISHYSNNEYKPVIQSHYGLFPEIVKSKTLQYILNKTNKTEYLEHVTNYIYLNENEFSIKKINIPKYLIPFENLRLTVDTNIDFEICKDLYRSVCINTYEYSLKKLIEIYKTNKKVRSIMKEQIEENFK